MLLSLIIFVMLQSSTTGSVAEDPSSSSNNARLAHAANLLSSGQFAQAQDVYESLLERQPANIDAQEGETRASEQLALSARASNDMNGALGELLRAQKFAPSNPRLLYDLGVLEDQIGLYHDADRTVLHLQKLTPGDSKTAYLLARVKLDLGQLQEAAAAMQEYLRVHPEDPTAHYGLGRILQLRLDNDAARIEFLRSLELKPDQTESHYQLADIALKAGQFEDAIAEAAKVLARDPRHGGALTDTGIARFRLKQYQEAADVLQQAVVDAPEYQPAHYYLGLTLARLGRKEDSQRELNLAMKLAGDENKKDAQRLQLNP